MGTPKKSKQKKRTRLNEPTGISLPGGRKVIAHITGTTPDKAGNVYVAWELHDRKSCLERARVAKTHRYDPKTESWDYCIRQMIVKAEDAFGKEYVDLENNSAGTPFASGERLFSAALETLDQRELAMLRKPGIRDSTWRNYFNSFRRLCRYLDQMERFDPEALKEMRDKMIADSAADLRSKGRRKAAETTDKMLRINLYALNALREITNEREGRKVLPDIPLHEVVVPGIHYQFEQIKWLPIEVLARLVARLFEKIDNGAIMGIALMLCLGLRTGEVCAALIGEMQMIDGCMVVYKVRHQGPERNRILKSLSAYRTVFFGQLLYDLLAARMEYLQGIGYLEEQIKNMPVASRADDPMQPMNPEDLSVLTRQLLLECGYQQENLMFASKLMALEPDYEADGNMMRSISAYIFRRNYATLICNCCDLAPGSGIEDYLLGHAMKKTLPFPIDNIDIQKRLVERMERLVLHPDHTRNPLYRAIPLAAGAAHDIGLYSAYTFIAEEDIEIEIEIQTREPNGTIFFESNSELRKRAFKRQPGKKDQPEDRANRPIVLLPPLPEEFDKFLAEAAPEDKD